MIVSIVMMYCDMKLFLLPNPSMHHKIHLYHTHTHAHTDIHTLVAVTLVTRHIISLVYKLTTVGRWPDTITESPD